MYDAQKSKRNIDTYVLHTYMDIYTRENNARLTDLPEHDPKTDDRQTCPNSNTVQAQAPNKLELEQCMTIFLTLLFNFTKAYNVSQQYFENLFNI